MNLLRKLWPSATSARSSAELSSAAEVGNELLVQDRRVVARDFHPLAATVRYGLADAEERVQIYNFSEKGLCFRCDVRIPVGAALEVTTSLPRKAGIWGGRKVRYQARVIRVSLERGEFLVAASIHGCDTLLQGTAAEETVASCQAAANSPEPSAGRKLERCTHVRTGVNIPEFTATKGQDSRQFSRYRCASQVQFRRTDDGQIMSGELVNLSLAGCRVHTPEPCPEGANIEIVLQVGRARIHTHGWVKTVEENKSMSVEFLGDLAQRLQRLQRFVHLLSAAGRLHSSQNS